MQAMKALMDQGTDQGKKQRWLGLYWPLEGEPDLRLLATHPSLASQVCLPRVANGRLGYRPWRPGMPLSPDETCVMAPNGSAELEPGVLGLLLAPALACDHAGIRLGYGGGWFDRLRCDPAWRQVPALAVMPSGCLCASLPRDPWDVPFDGWLDENGLHWLQPV